MTIRDELPFLFLSIIIHQDFSFLQNALSTVTAQLTRPVCSKNAKTLVQDLAELTPSAGSPRTIQSAAARPGTLEILWHPVDQPRHLLVSYKYPYMYMEIRPLWFNKVLSEYLLF